MSSQGETDRHIQFDFHYFFFFKEMKLKGVESTFHASASFLGGDKAHARDIVGRCLSSCVDVVWQEHTAVLQINTTS